MIEKLNSWLAYREIEVVAKLIGEYLEIDSAVTGGAELSEEECEALRAGIVAGLMSAREIVGSSNQGDLKGVAVRTYEAATRAYGRYLKEAENDED